LNKIYKWSVFS